MVTFFFMGYALTLTQVVEIINQIKKHNDFKALNNNLSKSALTLTFFAILCQEKNDANGNPSM